MAFTQQPLLQEEYQMKIIKDLGQQLSTNSSTRKHRLAIFECTKCLTHFKARATSTAAKNQTCCQKCTRNEEQTYKHPLYAIWNGIRQRCYNEKRKDYHKYGGKGVTMHSSWIDDHKAFMDFCLANGWEEGKVVDKDIKSRLLNISPPMYSPETLSFISVQQNAEEANGKQVVQYTLEGTFINEFPSATTAAVSLGKPKAAKSSIANCCRGLTKTSFGFIWKYK